MIEPSKFELTGDDLLDSDGPGEYRVRCPEAESYRKNPQSVTLRLCRRPPPVGRSPTFTV